MRNITLVLCMGCSFPSPTASNPNADGALPDGPRARPPMGACGKPGVLADDFSDGVAARTWIVDHAAQVSERAGVLSISPMPGVVDNGSGYRSDPYVDLRDAAAEVEVQAMVEPATGARAYFTMSHGADALGFTQVDGTLLAAVAGSSASTVYDPIAHRHWRIEEGSGTVKLSTSADAISWTVLHAAATPAWARAATITLGASNPSAAPAPGTVSFAQHSTFVAPATWCPTSSLSDQFNGDTTIGPEWARHARTSTFCAEYESGSAARADQYDGGACDASYGSSALYSLHDSSMVARITAIGTYVQGWITYLGAWDLDDNFLRLSFDQNQMCAEGTGIARTCAAYSSTQDLWRIRESAGTVYWETAQGPTPATWRMVHAAPTPFDASAVRARFGTRTDRDINTNIGLSIDSFN